MYRITHTFPSGVESTGDYATKEEVMAAWDTRLDTAIPGDTITLKNLDSGKMLSSYSPVGTGVSS